MIRRLVQVIPRRWRLFFSAGRCRSLFMLPCSLQKNRKTFLMPDFKEIQQQYSSAKKQYEAVRKEFYLTRQQVYLLDDRIAKALQERLLKELPAGDPLLNERAALQQRVVLAKNSLDAASLDLK